MALGLPHFPACLVCGVPFTGLSGRLAAMVGLGLNPANPELGNRCNSHFVAGDIPLTSALALKLPGEFTLGGAPLEASRSSQEGLIIYINVPVPVPDPPRQVEAAAREVLFLVATEEQISRLRQPLRAGVPTGFVETVRVGPEDLQLNGQVRDTASRIASLSSPGEFSLDAPTLKAVGLATEAGPLRWNRAYGLDNASSFERPHALAGGARRHPAAALALLLAQVAAPCAAMLSLGPTAFGISAGALFTALVPSLKTIGMNTGLRFSQRPRRDIRLVRLLTLLVYGAVFGELLLRGTVMKMPPR